MSKTVHINSARQLDSLLSSSRIVIIDFWAEWCGPCKTIEPVYENLATQLSRPSRVTFTKVNTDAQQDIARRYGVSAMPTFIVFKNGQRVETVNGADQRQLAAMVKKIAQEADEDGEGFGESSGSARSWLGASLPRGYKDITDEIDVKGLDLLNADSEFAGARQLFAAEQPAGLAAGKKGKEAAAAKEDGGSEGKKDWVESDTDEQLMLYLPFQSTLKVHTLQITSLAKEGESSEDVMRPKTVKLYTNRPHTLGFDEAEGVTPTQSITLRPQDWDEETGTAKAELRFVKFQGVTSLVVFVVDGEGSGERTRIDRLRLIGETGEKREMGKLEKIGDGD